MSAQVQREPAPALRWVFDPPPLPTVEGGFKTVLADPPWRFTHRTGKVAPAHRRLDRYSTSTSTPSARCRSRPRSRTRAPVLVGVSNALLPRGLRVMQAWGFRYVSYVWTKRRIDGGPDGRGVGFYFRNVTELILFGVRARMRTSHSRAARST